MLALFSHLKTFRLLRKEGKYGKHFMLYFPEIRTCYSVVSYSSMKDK